MKIIPKQIIIDEDVKETPLAKRICSKFKNVPKTITQNAEKIIEDFAKKKDSRSAGKYIFHVCKSKGPLLKDCPGTTNYLCCGYKVLNSIENCSLECTYCILQHYIKKPVITFHPELHSMLNEIDILLNSDCNELFRIGSGELSDSLLYDDITNYSTEIIKFLKNYENVLFEFKTKSTNIENLLAIDFEPKNILVGWSLNPAIIIKNEEHKASLLDERIRAARACQDKGYKITFHFDPIIIPSKPDQTTEYLDAYKTVIDKIFSNISPENIAWISLGLLRYPPDLSSTIETRFPKSKITFNDTILGKDGKTRYFKKLRIKWFKEIYNHIKSYSEERVFVYFCMESEEIWRDVFGYAPNDNDDFIKIFNKQLINKYNLKCKY